MLFSGKKWLKWLVGLTILILMLAVFCYFRISFTSKNFVFANVSQVSFHKTGLLLGTSKFLSNGHLNPYFTARIEATVKLYKAGKLKYIIASGDNSRVGYDEPSMMKEALVDQGVPDSAIVLDYAGFRTFDSVVRCREIFGQTSCIIISQKFHNERAVYLARHEGIDAVALNADNVQGLQVKSRAREVLARVKALIDVHVFTPKPKFLGERIDLK